MYLRELVRHDGFIIYSFDHFLHEIQVYTQLSVIIFIEETGKDISRLSKIFPGNAIE